MTSRTKSGAFGGLATAVLVAMILAGRVPFGVIVLGAVLGALSSLSSFGLVLIYRAQRFMNLSQASIGLLSGIVTAQLVSLGGWSFLPAALAGMVTGVLSALIAEMVLVGRMKQTARTLVMAGSLGLAYVFGSVQAALAAGFGRPPVYSPLPGFEANLFPVRFTGAHLIAAILVPLSLLGTAYFLRATRWGVAIRAVATNSERAQSLGIPQRTTSRIVWVIAGLLAALAGIPAIALQGPAFQAGPGAGVLLFALVPAIFGIRNLRAAIVVSIALGVFYQTALWITNAGARADLILAAGIIAALTLGNRRLSSLWSSVRHTASSWVFVAPAKVSKPVLLITSGVFVAVAVASTKASASVAQRGATALAFALAAVSVSIASGWAGQISLGHWALSSVGIAVAAMWGSSFDLALVGIFAAAAGAALSLVIGLASLSNRPYAYAATTLATAVAAPSLIFFVPRLRSGSLLPRPTLAGITIESLNALLLVIAAIVAASIILLVRFRASEIGIRIIASRDNPMLAAAQGIAVVRMRLVAFFVSGLVAGLAGCLFAFAQGIINPSLLAAERSLLLLAVAAIGGLGSVVGAAGAAVLVASVSLFATGAWSMLGTGTGLIIIVALAPNGLAGVGRRLVNVRAHRLEPVPA